MPITITSVTVHDVRFPTSRLKDGSDAMNPDPDYSAAYVVLGTDRPGLAGHGLTFTIGRGNEICVAAVKALAPLVTGRTLESFTADMGGFWRHITGDSQLRWIGPEKGAIHLATAAIVNAVWDLWAKVAGKPLWRLLADMTPGGAGALHRLPLPQRCADPGRGAGHPARSATRPRRSAIADAASAPATPPTPPPPAGSATPTRSCAGCAARPSPTASPTSRSRSAATWPTTCAAAASSARRSAGSAS